VAIRGPARPGPAWPTNLAYCKHNGVVDFWHVVVDMEFSALGSRAIEAGNRTRSWTGPVSFVYPLASGLESPHAVRGEQQLEAAAS
jgi:hypothetical protein